MALIMVKDVLRSEGGPRVTLPNRNLTLPGRAPHATTHRPEMLTRRQDPLAHGNGCWVARAVARVVGRSSERQDCTPHHAVIGEPDVHGCEAQYDLRRVENSVVEHIGQESIEHHPLPNRRLK